jgi:hypothetical protein
MDAMMIVAVCLFALLSGAVSCKIASGKSRRVWLWTTIGALFNLPGMMLVAFLPVHRPGEAKAPAAVALMQAGQPAQPIAV